MSTAPITMSCCTATAWPQLEKNYTGKGKFTDMGGFEAYIVGNPGPKGMIFATDIFGPREGGGRNQMIADQLAELGFYVVVPDYFHKEYAEWPAGAKMPSGPGGADLMKWLGKWTWNGSVKAEMEKTCEFMAKQGVQEMGCLGFCWGVGPVLELGQMGKIKCGASVHPSMNLLGVCSSQKADAYTNVKIPLWMGPAQDDSKTVKPGGSWIQALEKNGGSCEAVEFKDQFHGFMGRAPIDNEVNFKAVSHCWDCLEAFFKKHLNPTAAKL